MADNAKKELLEYLDWIGESDGHGMESFTEGSGLPTSLAPESRERASNVVKKIQEGTDLDPDDVGALEAIIIPGKRPVIDIRDGSFATPSGDFAHFGQEDIRERITAAIPSVGRIELPEHPSLPYGGTGFLVGEGLLMTNRHVAEIFTNGVGRDGLAFRTGSAEVDFVKELDSESSELFAVKRVAMIHPFWDMALLEISGLDDRVPLQLTVSEPNDLIRRDVAVIGYPAFDRRNRVDIQNEIFNSTFDVKRLQPGRLRERANVNSFGHPVSALTHDSSTLGGNSGSVVLDVMTGLVVALHFAGRYLKANFAVPAHELGRDDRVVGAGVSFDAQLSQGSAPWRPFWDAADPKPTETAEPATSTARRARSTPTAQLAPGAGATWTLPVEITVRVGEPATPGTLAPPPAPLAGVEAVEPHHDENLVARTGYNENFLGETLPLPTVIDPSIAASTEDGKHVLQYEHFSIVMSKERRLALYSCANVDRSEKATRPDKTKEYTRTALGGLGKNDREKWFLDPRIRGVHQLPDRFYNKDRQAFDKGHVVRREDPVWGETYEEVRRANGDTFHVTNCSPQVGSFNQRIWKKLEDLILKGAKSERLTVLTGPVFAAEDPVFHGVADDGPVAVQIPQQYWKVVVAAGAASLECFAFLLDQDLSDVKMGEPLEDQEFVVPDEWAARMISIDALEQLLGELTFPSQIHDADQFGEDLGEHVLTEVGAARYPI